MRRSNVLILISSLNYGGAEKQAILDANLLSENHNVFLVCFKKGPLLNLKSSQVGLIEISQKNYLIRTFVLIKIIRRERIKIIHSSLFAAMIVSVLAAVFSKDVLVFWHFHSHEYELPFLHTQLFRFWGRTEFVTKILYVNSELKLFLNERFNFPSLKTRVLYNSTSFQSELIAKVNEPVINVGFIGRLVRLKRVEVLIELASYLLSKECSQFKVIIVGDGPEYDSLTKLMRNMRLDDYISFEGFQSDVKASYNKIDLFALPSSEECLSMALIDAGVFGIPSVAFNVGGNNEIIDNNISGYIVSSNEEFFEKVHYLMINKNVRREMGKNASEICSRKFGTKKHLADLTALYAESLSDANESFH